MTPIKATIHFQTEELPENFTTQIKFDVISIEYHLMDDEQKLDVEGNEEVFSGFLIFAINPN